MKNMAVVLVVLAGLLVIFPAYAQQVGGGKKGVFAKHQHFAETPQEAFKEARERQCPVFLCVCDQAFSGNWAEPGEFCNEDVKKMAKYFVILVSHPTYPVPFKWAERYARRAGEQDDDTNIYEFFDCNGSHMSKYSMRKGASSVHLVKIMKKILKEKGKGASFSEYRTIKPEFEKANKILDVGWYSEAYKIFERLAKKKYKPAPPIVLASREKLKEITSKVSELFEEIKEKIEQGEKVEALVELRILRARASRLKIGTQLLNATVALAKDKAITSDDKKKAQDEGKACGVFLKGEGYAANGDDKKAKNYFERVTKNYKDTSFAEKAKERIAELE